MAQITSREEFESWLKDKPIDWLQVLTVRAGLRTMPFDFPAGTYNQALESETLSLFRVLCISWAARNFSEYDMAFAAALAARAANSKSSEPSSAQLRFSTIAMLAGESHYEAASGRHFKPDLAYKGALYVLQSHFDVASLTDVYWKNCQADCSRLLSYKNRLSAGRKITKKKLWPLGYDKNWKYSWWHFAGNLTDLDPTYQVWINWYNRRIEGHDSAFDIPGDSDRTEDKKILARLADATDEDFWNKGAPHVNTTLQSWIDEAREQAAIDYVASGAPLKIGSDAELAARPELASRLASVEDALAALKDQLASLTQTAHGGIGHNQPENATSLRDDEIITLKQQVASLETLLTGVQTQLAKPVPDIGQLVQDVPKLNRWARAMCVIADMSSDKVAEGFEKEIGAASAKGLVAGLVAIVLAALAAFSHYFYTYWIPLLIG